MVLVERGLDDLFLSADRDVSGVCPLLDLVKGVSGDSGEKSLSKVKNDASNSYRSKRGVSKQHR